MEDVVESGPAWESGVRKGDIIVTVNDWLIVLMDRAQVKKLFAFKMTFVYYKKWIIFFTQTIF